jgi:F-type H+-transporting ATPase subunit c
LQGENPGTTNWQPAVKIRGGSMKKIAMWMTALAGVALMAPAVFAQSAPAETGNSRGLMAIAAGFGIAIAAFGAAFGQGRVAAAACEGIARNPGAGGAVRAAMILGLVFIETLVLFTFVLIYLKA